jgi:uncharacterized protein YjiS (DUF1127 family)
MSGSLAQQVNDPCTDPAALQARSAADLWTMWLRVGRALLLRAAPPLTVWRQRAWERRMLAHMTERDLKDIGLTRQHAAWEINKPFWKA